MARAFRGIFQLVEKCLILNKSKDISNLPAIAWGQMHEKDGTQSRELCVKQESPYLAASPNGMFRL